MNKPLVIKKKLVKKNAGKINNKKFKFLTMLTRPTIKSKNKLQVFKCGNRAKAIALVNNPKRKNLKTLTKLKKTNGCQLDVVKQYKQKCYVQTLSKKHSKKFKLKQNSTIKTNNVFKLHKKPNVFLKNVYLLLIGVFIGFVNGFWGGGGGMICVPTLTKFLKQKDKTAHATTILIMLPLSLASFVVYLCKKSFVWSTTGFVAGGFVLGGIAGALILKKINNTVLRIVFSLVIIAGAIKLLI